MPKSRLRAYAVANELLLRHQITTPPVPVEILARAEGLRIIEAPGDSRVSGMLFCKEGRHAIAVNAAHSTARRRFTVAHEIGHYLLHVVGRVDAHAPGAEARVHFRDGASAAAVDPDEIEANAFAASVLMPEEMVRGAVQTRANSVADAATIKSLAKRFEVSVQAMTIRLDNLHLLNPV